MIFFEFDNLREIESMIRWFFLLLSWPHLIHKPSFDVMMIDDVLKDTPQFCCFFFFECKKCFF